MVVKCRIKPTGPWRGEQLDQSLTCWQYDPKAPRPVWVFRVAHKIGDCETLTMIDHQTNSIIEVNPTDWFLWDKESGYVAVLAAEEFERGMEIIP